MLNSHEERSIPGMVEPVESELLYKSANSLNFQEGDSVVEFGTFFGRSTNAICQGLTQNSSYTANGNFFAYDSFCCDVSGSFKEHVYSFAATAKVTQLIQKNNQTINFFPVFEHFLEKYIDKQIVIPIQAELKDSEIYTNSILLMHIDSPKFYEEFKTILFDFLPKMKIGGVVIFQDFFYHWSATLIAVIGILLKKKYLVITETAASSLACKIIKEIEIQDAIEIDFLMADEPEIPSFIDIAISECRKIEVASFDRQDQFLPRVTLAKCQWLRENNRASEGDSIWTAMLDTRQAIIQDMTEMAKYNFSISELYKLDHKINIK
jgi:hypothetical protein